MTPLPGNDKDRIDAVTIATTVSVVSRLLGRGSESGPGLPESITIGAGLVMTDTTLSATGGGGGAGNFGTATLDFGAFPGGSDASVAVTGQAGIASNSRVCAWLQPAATSDHSADEHMLETLSVFAGNVVAGTGFTVYGVNNSQLAEPVEQGNRGGRGGMGTRLFGAWNIAWTWG